MASKRHQKDDHANVKMSLRKITKNCGSLTSDEALSKLFYVALSNIDHI